MNSTIVGYIFAIASALSYGSSQALTRRGVSELTTPLVGATVSLLAGLLVLFLMNLRGIRPADLKIPPRAALFMALSGLCASSGIAINYFALTKAPLVIVAPVVSTNTLIAILFTHLFLRRLERITLRTVIGAVFVVVGVAIMSISRAFPEA